MKKQNIYQNIPQRTDDEFFENLVNKDGIKIQRIVSQGHTSPKSGWYVQKDNEWVIVIEGEAVITYENGDKLNLQKGDYINIPAFTKHKVSWTDPDIKTIWVAVHY